MLSFNAAGKSLVCGLQRIQLCSTGIAKQCTLWRQTLRWKNSFVHLLFSAGLRPPLCSWRSISDARWSLPNRLSCWQLQSIGSTLRRTSDLHRRAPTQIFDVVKAIDVVLFFDECVLLLQQFGAIRRWRRHQSDDVWSIGPPVSGARHQQIPASATVSNEFIQRRCAVHQRVRSRRRRASRIGDRTQDGR